VAIPIVTITSEGQKLDPTIELLSVEVRRELNRVPEAHLTLLDGSVAKRKFELSNAAHFEPGKRVTIALRYENEGSDTVVFDGLVVRHGVETETRGSTLRIELKDAAFKLARTRKSAVFRKNADDEAIRKLIGDAKLEVGDLEVTKTKHEELIQYYASDWDFIVSRADVQGLVVHAHKGKISVLPMVSSAAPKARLEYGLGDSLDFELTIDGGHQWAAVSSVAWDVQKLEPTAATDAKDPSVTVGNVDPAAIAKKLGGDAYSLLHPGVAVDNELAAWADSRLARSRLALLRGRVTVPGRVDIAPRDLVELAGIGDRFDGKAFVSGVVDRVDHDGWRTELKVGLDPEWFAREPDLTDVPAAGLVPPMNGLQIGVVGDFESDERGEHRVKVALAGIDKKQGAVWARVAQPDAGKDRGFVYWPEPGDEVVVGFVYGDPRQAVILGALHGSVNTPPPAAGAPTKENDKRAIVSKSGSVISFDDEKKAVSISTPGKNTIVVDDEAKAITIADQHGNTITLDDKGITLKSAKDFTIDAASGKVVIKGSTVDVQ
jgi:Rhs element Vgr protein